MKHPASGLNDVDYVAWLKTNGATSVGSSISDLEYEMLLSHGAPRACLQDMWAFILEQAGYTGSVPDKQKALWDSGGTLSMPTTTYSIATSLDNGYSFINGWWGSGFSIGTYSLGINDIFGGLSFTGATPPKDAVITSASLDFYVSIAAIPAVSEMFGDKGAGLLGVTAQPSVTNLPEDHWFDTANRPTTARVTGIDLSSAGEHSINGAGLIAVIQEIVSLSNWAAGNRINLGFRPTSFTTSTLIFAPDRDAELTLTWT